VRGLTVERIQFSGGQGIIYNVGHSMQEQCFVI